MTTIVHRGIASGLGAAEGMRGGWFLARAARSTPGSRGLTWAGIGLGAMLCSAPAHALITLGSDNAMYATAPLGDLAGSGWQYQGNWGNFLGTAIGPYAFITSADTGGSVGDVFSYGGNSYTTTRSFADPGGSDLVVWQVSQPMPQYATYYKDTAETLQDVVIFGRGADRGDSVLAGSPTPTTRGWLWGTENHTQRWGENQVHSISYASGYRQLRMDFDNNANANEATYSIGDKGGGVFMRVGGEWQLVGVNAGVALTYSKTDSPGTQGFYAALYNTSGMYWSDDDGAHWTVEDPGSTSSYYATSVGDKSAWITSVVPEPHEYGVTAGLALAGYAMVRRRMRKASAPAA